MGDGRAGKTEWAGILGSLERAARCQRLRELCARRRGAIPGFDPRLGYLERAVGQVLVEVGCRDHEILAIIDRSRRFRGRGIPLRPELAPRLVPDIPDADR